MSKKRLTIKEIRDKAAEIGWLLDGDSKNGYKLSPQNNDWSCVPPETQSALINKKLKTIAAISNHLIWLQDLIQKWQLEQQAITKVAQLCWQEIEVLYPASLKNADIHNFLSAVSNSVYQLHEKAEDIKWEKENAFYEANKETWIKEQQLLTKDQIMQQWQLIHEAQFQAALALNWINSVEIFQFPRNCYHPQIRMSARASGYYRINAQKIDAQKLNESTLITRLQAADFLTITPAKFDQLKKKYNLAVAEERYTSYCGQPRKYYLYKFSDILELRSLNLKYEISPTP